MCNMPPPPVAWQDRKPAVAGTVPEGTVEMRRHLALFPLRRPALLDAPSLACLGGQTASECVKFPVRTSIRDMPSACKLMDYLREWETSTDPAVRLKAWQEILSTNADEVFSIGTVNGIRQPVVVGPKVRNVPEKGYHAWDPGGYIGLYQPDTFWISQ